MLIFPRKQSDMIPFVSVVICTYNREQFISQTIDSVLNQKRDFAIEILIGDDESSDGTREILNNYQSKFPDIITLVFNKQNKGVGNNWANLMKLVKGKYVALCDDDDYWNYDEKLQKQIDILERNKDIGLVHTNYRTEDIINKKFKEHTIKNHIKKNLLLSLFEDEYSLLTSSVVLRNSLIEQYVNLDDYIKYNFPIQDWETWVIIAKHTNFYHLDISTVTYRYTENSITRPVDFNCLEKKFERDRIMYQYLCEQLPDDLKYSENEWNNYINEKYLIFSYNSNDYTRAKFYGQKINHYNLRVICSKTKLLFNLFIKIKGLKKNLMY